MGAAKLVGTERGSRPLVLPVRQRARIVHRALEERLETILPQAMRETGFDM